MKKTWIFASLTIAFGAALLLRATDTPAPVTFMDHDKMAEALAKSGVVARTSNYLVLGAHRAGPGQVEVHEKETDVIYITDGEATFVTGGKMIGGKMTPPGLASTFTVTKEGQWLGTNIEGGETHHVVKGDVFVIPAGTPHWFKEVKSVNYFVVKVIKP